MSFTVAIQTGTTPQTVGVTASASAPEAITAGEAVAFKIDGDNLTNLYNQVDGGGPSCTFLGDPCNDGEPWYATYGWQPVTAQYSIVAAVVSSITVTPEIAATTSFTNHTGKQAEFQPSLTTSVTNTVTSSFAQTDTVGIAQEIEYGISFLGTGGSGKTSLNYSHAWETTNTEETAEGFALTAAASVPVAPGETCNAALNLSKGTLTVDVTYEVSLVGYATAGYYHEYNGHHIWAHEINDLLTKGGLATTVTATETITIEFYTDASIVVTNGQGDAMEIPRKRPAPTVPIVTNTQCAAELTLVA